MRQEAFTAAAICLVTKHYRQVLRQGLQPSNQLRNDHNTPSLMSINCFQ